MAFSLFALAKLQRTVLTTTRDGRPANCMWRVASGRQPAGHTTVSRTYATHRVPPCTHSGSHAGTACWLALGFQSRTPSRAAGPQARHCFLDLPCRPCCRLIKQIRSNPQSNLLLTLFYISSFSLAYTVQYLSVFTSAWFTQVAVWFTSPRV